MNPDDARSALADAHRLQERTRDEHVRQQFAWPYMCATALGIFIAFGSTDLPAPWDTLAFLLGEGVLIGSVILQRRRAAVRMKANVGDGLFVLLGAFLVLAGYIAFNVVASLGVLSFGLPTPRIFAAAALALLFLALAGPSRRLYTALVRNT
ncbi:hypothetical protein BJF79_17625 [Actinomadura sp. CNU-125]|uniref:hypothetical protein n=1 Tax=Actinomadura sp. CNU-125 TaxID=1904961 RepID=UPI00095BF1EB|nr:hypothetical protein [Actinomadura sp. CNU-125]OLT17689.1 hypothetical protein BJF79_17625 [Actinomadura sp. CNU-125]